MLNLRTLLNRAGITKRSNLDAAQTVFLLMRVFLRDSSIAMFCRKSMQEFVQVSKDPLCDLLKNQKVNWRWFHQLMVQKVYRSSDLKPNGLCAFVVNDAVKVRHGKNKKGVSRHIHHTSGRCVMGQQVVQLRLVSGRAFSAVGHPALHQQQGNHRFEGCQETSESLYFPSER